ncbi:MAG: homocysteine S-methyltransferase family protein [candidate division WOR-3 bacterium]
MILRERIQSGRPLLADGALGSLLMERGLKPGESPESFNLKRPEVLVEIVQQYVEAGAEIVQANSFGANRFRLVPHGLADKVAEVNRAAVEIARAAAAGRAMVWASIGPTGRMLRPAGDAEPDEIAEAFGEQARALVQAGPDIIAVETMTDLAEALLAVRAVREASADIVLVATLTFELKKRGFFTVMGNSIADAAVQLVAAGADVVGSNCGNGIDNMVRIAREFRDATGMPLAFRPNAGMPQLVDGDVRYPETPEFMAAHLPELLETKPAIVGGCCGTKPYHIRAFRQVIATMD